jgi:hypothetical protein
VLSVEIEENEEKTLVAGPGCLSSVCAVGVSLAYRKGGSLA